jgi:PAS domain S-box-containing protein
MSKSDPHFRWSKLSTILRYAIAALTVAVTLVLVNVIVTFLHTEPFVSLFICAIMFVAWFCGFGPALFATALAIVAFHYYLLGPINSFTAKSNLFAADSKDLPRIVLFTIVALFVSFLGAAQRGAAESLRRSRDDLRRSEAFLVEGQRISHTGSWGWNISSGKLVWSEEHCRIFGADPNEALTFQLFQSKVHPEDRALVQQTLDKSIAERSSFSLEYRIVPAEGAVRYVQGEGRPVLTQAGDCDDYIGTTMDITERKRNEAALRNAQGELARVARLTTLGELAASIAHEINQPLAGMVASSNACLRWLTRDEPKLDEARRAAQRIVRDGHRAGDIMKSVRALTGTTASDMTELDINIVIRETLGLIRSELHLHDIALETKLSGGLAPVMGDQAELQQVILNLVMNAIEAMSAAFNAPRLLCVRSQDDGLGAVLIAIEDSGPGVAPEAMDQLFEAFFSTKPGGMGMGLSICRSIVHAHGGCLWVSPASPRGAVFQFTVPIAAGVGGSTAPSSPDQNRAEHKESGARQAD